jgi:hypothetical protein
LADFLDQLFALPNPNPDANLHLVSRASRTTIAMMHERHTDHRLGTIGFFGKMRSFYQTGRTGDHFMRRKMESP